MKRERRKLRNEAYSIDALHRDGCFRSSDETSVMEVERREATDKLTEYVNFERRRSV
jgi:hypothetical protein